MKGLGKLEGTDNSQAFTDLFITTVLMEQELTTDYILNASGCLQEKVADWLKFISSSPCPALSNLFLKQVD